MSLERAWQWLRSAPGARYLMFGLAGLALVAYAWFAWSAHQARASLDARVAVLRQQARVLDGQAAEIARLRQARPAVTPAADLRAVTQSLAQAAGISGALVRIDVLDESRVQVIFGTVAFADWLAWVAALEARHLWVESCRIETAPGPGLVSVTAVFSLGKS